MKVILLMWEAKLFFLIIMKRGSLNNQYSIFSYNFEKRVTCFVLTIDNGSRIAAAKKLNVSKSNITRSIQALEKMVGSKLIKKENNRIIPTDVGRILYKQACAILNNINNFVTEIQKINKNEQNHIKIHCNNFIVKYLPKYIKKIKDELLSHYPDLRFTISIMNKDSIDLLKNEEIDFIFDIDSVDNPYRSDKVLKCHEWISDDIYLFLDKTEKRNEINIENILQSEFAGMNLLRNKRGDDKSSIASSLGKSNFLEFEDFSEFHIFTFMIYGLGNAIGCGYFNESDVIDVKNNYDSYKINSKFKIIIIDKKTKKRLSELMCKIYKILFFR